MSNKELIDSLIANGYLKTPRIIEAFRAIDRKDFVPQELEDLAYVNEPLPIGRGQTISQPLTVAFMLELLDPKPGQKILDVGFGSGWTTVLLAQIVGEKGRVYGLEIIPQLCDFGKKNVQKYPHDNIELHCGSGWDGLSKEVQFDRILVSAAAPEIPPALKSELKVSGKMVIPIHLSVVVLDKISENKFKEREHFGFSFVPLVKE